MTKGLILGGSFELSKDFSIPTKLEWYNGTIEGFLSQTEKFYYWGSCKNVVELTKKFERIIQIFEKRPLN